MSSGDSLAYFTPSSNGPPATIFATPDTFSGGADTPVQNLMVLDFDDSADEFADFQMLVPSHYTASAGMTVIVGWSCTTAGGTDGVAWTVNFKSVTSDADDLDTITFSSVQTFTVSDPASVAGEVLYPSLAVSFANCGSPLEGEMLFVRIGRDISDAGDTLAEDAQLHSVEIRET